MQDREITYVTCSRCGYGLNLPAQKKCERCGHVLRRYIYRRLWVAVATLVLLVGGGIAAWFVLRHPQPQEQPANTQEQPADTPVSVSPSQDVLAQDVAAFLSEGDRFFIDSENPQKQAAAVAFRQGDYATAIPRLEALRKQYRNDPEILIYLNNARLGTSPAVTAAIVVGASDSTSTTAPELLRGMAQLQTEYNLSRGNGLPIRLVIGDDGNDLKRAQAIAQALSADGRIVFAIGHGHSPTTLAAAPVYEQNQLVLVSPTSTATQLTQLGSSRKNYVYRTVPNNQVMGTDLARYALRRFRQIAIFYDSQSSHSNSFKKSLVKTFQQEGGRVVEEIDLTQGDGGVERVGTLKADAIALLPDPLSVELAIAVAKANRNRLPAIGSVSMYRFETLQQAGRELEGAVLPAPWHPLTSADPSFPQRANSLWGGDVNWRTALSFDTGRVLQALVQEGVTSRAGIADRLADSNFSAQGATGTIQFLPSGDRIGQPLLVRIQPGARSKTGFDFVPIQ